MFSALRQTSRSGLVLCKYARPRGALPSATFNIARTIVTKRYTKEHEVISYDDATSLGRLHITKHASDNLGDVVFVELPTVGTEITKGDQIGAVESVKAASDIYAPVSGTVEEINRGLDDKPGLMSSDPENAGWLCDLKVTKPEELDSLLSLKEYIKFCEEES